jgi:hypothetical protein
MHNSHSTTADKVFWDPQNLCLKMTHNSKIFPKILIETFIPYDFERSYTATENLLLIDLETLYPLQKSQGEE